MISKHLPELRSALASFQATEMAVQAANDEGREPTDDEYWARDDEGVQAAYAAENLDNEIRSGSVALVNGQALANLLAAREDVGRDVRDLIDALTREP